MEHAAKLSMAWLMSEAELQFEFTIVARIPTVALEG
jgi:hypothetical protein